MVEICQSFVVLMDLANRSITSLLAIGFNPNLVAFNPNLVGFNAKFSSQMSMDCFGQQRKPESNFVPHPTIVHQTETESSGFGCKISGPQVTLLESSSSKLLHAASSLQSDLRVVISGADK